MFQCCSSLAVLCYLMEDDITEILEVMRIYETIFSGSYLKVREYKIRDEYYMKSSDLNQKAIKKQEYNQPD